MTTGSPHDRAAVAALLDRELPDPRFREPRYLTWLYDENPVGRAVEGDVAGPDGLPLAHYALVPQEWRTPDGVERQVISLNAVVRSGAQRRGTFTALAEDVFGRAAAEGCRGTITVANASSTPAFLRHLGFRLLTPLPVRLCRPLARARRVRSSSVDAAWLESDAPDRLVDGLDALPVRHRTQHWTATALRWRLASPITRYAVHEADDVAAVSTLARAARLPFAVILKLFPRRTGVDPSAVVAAACRAHRAPTAIYAGFNAHARVRGPRLPRRILPSPLNLVVRSFDPTLPVDDLEVDTYEFLDADHY